MIYRALVYTLVKKLIQLLKILCHCFKSQICVWGHYEHSKVSWFACHLMCVQRIDKSRRRGKTAKSLTWFPQESECSILPLIIIEQVSIPLWGWFGNPAEAWSTGNLSSSSVRKGSKFLKAEVPNVLQILTPAPSITCWPCTTWNLKKKKLNFHVNVKVSFEKESKVLSFGFYFIIRALSGPYLFEMGVFRSYRSHKKEALDIKACYKQSFLGHRKYWLWWRVSFVTWRHENQHKKAIRDWTLTWNTQYLSYITIRSFSIWHSYLNCQNQKYSDYARRLVLSGHFWKPVHLSYLGHCQFLSALAIKLIVAILWGHMLN